MSEALVGIADRGSGGVAAGGPRLLSWPHISRIARWGTEYQTAGTNAGCGCSPFSRPRAKRRERAALVRLEAFVRETVLPRTDPNTTVRWRVLEALDEAGGLGTARMVEMSSGDVIPCTCEAGHYDPGDLPGFKRRKSDGAPGRGVSRGRVDLGRRQSGLHAGRGSENYKN